MSHTTAETPVKIRDRIETKLVAAFQPALLKVIDESHKHAGHVGHAGGAGQGGETHFRVQIVAEKFAGQSRVARHRAVQDLLAQEFSDGVHALALEIKAPDE